MTPTSDDGGRNVTALGLTPASIKDLLAVAFRRFWLVILIVLVTTGGTVIGVYVKPPEYNASVSFLVHRERPPSLSDFGGPNWTMNRNEVIQTEIAILKSKSVIGRAVDNLDLPNRPQTADGLKGFKRKIDEGLIATGLKDGMPSRARWIRHISNNIAIKPAVQSNVIVLRVSGSSPKLVTEIAEALSDAYLERHAELYRHVGVYEFYEEQVRISKQNLDQRRQEEEEAGGVSGVNTVDEQLTLLLTRRRNVIEQLGQAELDSKQIRSSIAALESRKDHNAYAGPVAIPEKYGSLQALQRRLAELESERLSKSQSFRSDEPRMLSLSSQIRTVRASLLEKMKATSTQIRSYIGDLKAQEVEIADQRKGLDQDARTLKEYSLAVAAAEKTYIEYRERLEEARLNSIGDSQLVNVSIIDAARTPEVPVRSRLAYITLALGLSLILGVGVAVVVEIADPTMHTPAEARHRLELPVLAVLDAEPARRSRRLTRRSA